MRETGEKDNDVEIEETTKRDNWDENTKNENMKIEETEEENEANEANTEKIASPNGSDLSHVTTFEDIMDIVGTRGRWNLLLFLLCSYTSFVAALQTLSYQFLGATPDHWCYIEPLVEAGWSQEQIVDFAIPVDEAGKPDSCLRYEHNYTLAAEMGYDKAKAALQAAAAPVVSCYARDFNRSQYQSTVTTEWDLVCERRALYSTTQAASQIGKLVGYFFLGYLIDTYGRRRIMLYCLVLSIATAFGAAVAPNVETYIIIRVFINVANSGCFLSTFVLMMETCGTKERTKIGTLTGLSWAIGYAGVPGIAYLIRTWKWLQAALSLPALMLISFYWLLPESPRWLIQQGRHQEALTVLKSASKVNKRTLPPDQPMLAAFQRLCAEQESAEYTAPPAVPDGDGATPSKWKLATRWAAGVLKNYLAVLRVREMRHRALVVFFCWFSAATVYYGLSLNATNISVNVYLYVFLGGVLEFVSYILLWPLVAFLGRVKSHVILNFFCGAAILVLALCIYFFPEAPSGLIMFFSLTGKMCITASFTLIWMFTLELFPTKYRSLITGQASVNARIGSITSPYINDILGEVIVWAPSAVFCVLALIAGGVSLLLPETKGRGMPEGYSFHDKPNTKGSANQAYLPDPECPSKESPIALTNKDPGQQ
ncbi:organic cation transporter protein-like isoform X5 [Eriocheir sinensis]|uniref:organic cation transporter protein-like isoform X4 n=1 Tax=Eriocheir sinensis TaxID=95602 RepID=UPI0021C65BF2|nr:organic cation transporter protein-like isoform X4 [Eriocheir sinensis]XP_050726672.1 organic cation transporter protein-like isoform X5 [Eriocheir sinensis]